jgi:hypothetical protein
MLFNVACSEITHKHLLDKFKAYVGIGNKKHFIEKKPVNK